MQERGRRQVDRWETLEVLYSGYQSTPKADIGLVVEIRQPVFEDGGRGYPKMGATLKRGDRFLRLSCFDGDVSELEALRKLLDGVEKQGLSEFQSAYDGHVATHKSAYQNPGRNNGNKQQYGGVGGGLSRFSGESKSDKRRRKRGRNHERP